MQQKPPPSRAGDLARDASFARHKAQKGTEHWPDGSGDESTSLDALLGNAPRISHPDLPEPDMRPPVFLNMLEAMLDIYQRVHHRTSEKTKSLLTSPDLADFLSLLEQLFENETLSRKADARVLPSVLAPLEGNMGPLLSGFTDPKLTEPWRLFLDGWDIWIADEEKGGVELFWEGEGDTESSPDVVQLMQTIGFLDGELVLSTTFGDALDTVTFDGQSFYRLKNDRV